ncbi:hypothetical protein F5B22DRAFT_603621 [Xylaria bambusicola]|uniref:uncharacterized protein n=1 Tax=Xylaria bambusicola TaxID=326684 RepID=UPI0020089825|nr:uncharacterized protein F5B22DRAFT_603621 [Xylaria bambusicola]KAI0517635.1 hypothetical protein F5B22DRAFT_603621 [Xylaria bambusicola]
MELDSQESSSSPSMSQFHRHHNYHQSRYTSPPRPASAASFCSSSSSSSFADNQQSRLSVRPRTSPSLHSISIHDIRPSSPDLQSSSPSAGSHRSSLSGKFGSTSSLIDGLSGLTVEHDGPQSSQVATSQPGHSFSIDDLSLISSSSLDEALSQLASEHDRSPPTYVPTAGNSRSRQPNAFRTSSSRAVSELSFDTSSSDSVLSVADQMDDNFFEPVMEEETPPSSQSTTKDAQLGDQDRELSECSDLSDPISPVHEPKVIFPAYRSPSSTGKLSYTIQTPMRSTPSSPVQSPQSPRSPRSPRLYRTRSGSLASVAELRQRREFEEERLNIVLKGIHVLGKDQTSSPQRVVSMSVDAGGRWRIHAIYEPLGP